MKGLDNPFDIVSFIYLILVLHNLFLSTNWTDLLTYVSKYIWSQKIWVNIGMFPNLKVKMYHIVIKFEGNWNMLFKNGFSLKTVQFSLSRSYIYLLVM